MITFKGERRHYNNGAKNKPKLFSRIIQQVGYIVTRVMARYIVLLLLLSYTIILLYLYIFIFYYFAVREGASDAEQDRES